MFNFEFTEKTLLFGYFIALMFLGAIILYLPISYSHQVEIKFIDALFTSVSAVSVTGLLTIPISDFSSFGQLIIMFLVQFGGLGFITITTFYLIIPRKKLLLMDVKIIKQYFIENIEYNPKNILKNILLTTILIEFSGALLIYLFFIYNGEKISFFEALFHAISAFCNSGLSLYEENIYKWRVVPQSIVVIAILIFMGGLGFIVHRDIFTTLKSGRKFSEHTKIVVFISLILVITGSVVFFITEYTKIKVGNANSFSLIFNSIFYSVSTRTAGFSYFDNSLITENTKLLSMPFMFIGGAPGSTAGGIKVTTFFLVLIAVLKQQNGEYGFEIGRHNVPPQSIRLALIFFIRAIFLLFIFFISLLVTELKSGFHISDLAYEVFSAFGTVGLSAGITSKLSYFGKIIIIITMFAGRVGLFTLAIYIPKERKVDIIRPRQEILVG